MLLRRDLRLLGSLLTLGCSAFSQCYDLRSTQLSDPQGRFQEWWDKPIWHAKPGDGNFTLDNTTWGRRLHFAAFMMGTIRKTPHGWTAQRFERQGWDLWCDPTPERSGIFCYVPPYQIPPPSATIRIRNDDVLERWVVETDGKVRYTHSTRGVGRIIENRSSYRLLPGELGFDAQIDAVATLDLNTGLYTFEEHDDGNGWYIRRYPGVGVKVRRVDTFQAKAQLTQVPCPVSAQKASLSPNDAPAVVKMNDEPLCVVQVNRRGSQGHAAKQEWEFVQNPANVSSADGCLVVFQGAAAHAPPEPALRSARESK
jgi:hypothetical protein